MPATSSSCLRPTAASAGSASRSASSRRATTCCVRACAFSPTSISAARRAMPCRRGSTSGSRRTSRSCSGHCWRWPARRTSPASRAASRSSSPKRSACWSAHRVAEEVKGLDQEARAALRKYGVRFGAYHLYLPNLLKPGPRALAVQLWALKEATPDTKGLDDVPHLAASGRTSFPADKDVPKALYRVVGYRVCGERAVRVDILERLADLIRPALSWRSGSPQPKPPGAVQGRRLHRHGNMTSLTGTSGEDFASVLRSLGYRMEKRPKPAEPTPVAEETPAAPATESAAAETDAEPPQSCRLSPLPPRRRPLKPVPPRQRQKRRSRPPLRPSPKRHRSRPRHRPSRSPPSRLRPRRRSRPEQLRSRRRQQHQRRRPNRLPKQNRKRSRPSPR